ncbi:MAG TPA: nucleotidyltransferase domain-containing protein [Gaiellaceae bacterium]|jgi:predicted nucleotidyltransferase
MASLADATLDAVERRVLDRFVHLLEAELGADLRSVWLFGSRARGEEPGAESDVDVLVVATRASLDDRLRVVRLVHEAAEAEGANPAFYAVKLYDPDRVAQRRAIRSFFMQEVDRDKIVLAGEP